MLHLVVCAWFVRLLDISISIGASSYQSDQHQQIEQVTAEHVKEAVFLDPERTICTYYFWLANNCVFQFALLCWRHSKAFLLI